MLFNNKESISVCSALQKNNKKKKKNADENTTLWHSINYSRSTFICYLKNICEAISIKWISFFF